MYAFTEPILVHKYYVNIEMLQTASPSDPAIASCLCVGSVCKEFSP